MMNNLAKKIGISAGEVTNLKILDQVVMELKENLVNNQGSGGIKLLWNHMFLRLFIILKGEFTNPRVR